MTYREVGGSLVWQGTVSGTDQTAIGLYEPTSAVRIFLENPVSPNVIVFTGVGDTVINSTASGVITITGAGNTDVITNGSVITINSEDGAETALIGTDGIAIVSGSNTTTIQGFRPEFVATSGSLQSQLDNLDDVFATDVELLALSGSLSQEIDDDITTHATNANAHHTRYTDSEAISATEAARFTLSGTLSAEIDSDIGAHTAIASAHHTRYDDSEAIAALESITSALAASGVATDSNLVSVSGHLQTRINEIDVDELENALVGTEGIIVISGSSFDIIQGFRSEFVSASGSLQGGIDTNSASISSNSALITTTSGHLQSEIDSIIIPEFIETAITGADGITVVSGANTVDLTGFRPEFVSASGYLQNQINTFDADEIENALVGTDGIVIASGSSFDTIQGFRPEFISASGFLQTSISTNANNISNNTGLITTVSGHLQSQINSIDVDELEPAVVGSDGITIVSGSNNIEVVGFRNELVSVSGSLQSQLDNLDGTFATDNELLTVSGALSQEIDDNIIAHAALADVHHTRYSDSEAVAALESITSALTASGVAVEATLVSVSGHLQSEIDSIFIPDFIETAVLGFDGITVVSGSNSVDLTGFRSEFVAASGSLQGGISTNSGNIANNAASIITTSGHLQNQINSIDVDELENALVGADGITVISGSPVDVIQGFRTEFVATSGSLQGSIDANTNSLSNHTSDTTIHFTEGSIDHTVIQNVGSNSHAQIDAHLGNLAASGTSVTSGLTSHTNDNTIHFTEGSIDHTNIQNIGTNNHTQIDTHIADSTVHFTQGAIDHGNITGLVDDDHPQYSLVDGSRPFTGTVSGVNPTVGPHLATKSYVDSAGISTPGSTTVSGVATWGDTTGGSLLNTTAIITSAGRILAGQATGTSHSLPGNTATSVSIGTATTKALANNAVAIGAAASANSADTVAIGSSTVAATAGFGGGAVAIGNGTTANSFFGAVAIGVAATSTNSFSTAIGTSSNAGGSGALAVGNSAVASQLNSLALGSSASSTHSDSVAIGSGATTTTTNQIQLGTATQTVSILGLLTLAPRTSDPVSPANGTVWIRSDTVPPQIRYRSGGVTYQLSGTAI